LIRGIYTAPDVSFGSTTLDWYDKIPIVKFSDLLHDVGDEEISGPS
jgi:hypothetical protein